MSKTYHQTLHIPPLSIRGYLWRLALVFLCVVVGGAIRGVSWLTSSQTITQAIQHPDVTETLSEVGSFWKEGDQITITSGGLIAEPEIITIGEGDDARPLVNTTIACVDFFNQSIEGIVATTEALCISSDSKQQVITRQQVLEAQEKIKNPIKPKYKNINELLKTSPIIINKTKLKKIGQDLIRMQNDADTLVDIINAVKEVRISIAISLIIMGSMIVLFVLVPIWIIIMAIYTLIARGIESLFGLSQSYDQTRSTTRLRATIRLIASMIGGIHRGISLLIRSLIATITSLIRHSQSS